MDEIVSITRNRLLPARGIPLLAIRLSTCLVLSFALATSSCAGENVTSTAAPLVQGATDDTMFREFSRLIDEGHREFRVTSFGGDELQGIKIAQLIGDEGVSLTVERYCTSSCAQYLLAAAENVSVQENSLVSFHMNSFGLVNDGYIDEDFPEFEKLSLIAKQAEALYRKSGKDPDFMRLATQASQLQCIIYRNGAPQSAFAKFEVWVPSRQILAGYGFEISGSLPGNFDEAASIARRYLSPQTTLWFGPLVPRNSHKRLGACRSGEQSA